MLIKDLAICIRAVDYSETSQIVTFFTRNTGKVGAIAKGSKRQRSPFDGPIELFSYGEIVFSNSNKEKLATLTEFHQKSFRHLADNILSLNYCLFAAELMDKFTNEYDPHPALFDRFFSLLQNTNEQQIVSDSSSNLLTLLIQFELGLLKEIGLLPELGACANCKNTVSSSWTQGYFSNSAPGLICKDCQASFPDRTRLRGETLNCLSDLKRLVKVSNKTKKEIERLLVSYLTYTLGREPKMAKYILRT
jgi:DNA repair protein RecO (recombination protein O)